MADLVNRLSLLTGMLLFGLALGMAASCDGGQNGTEQAQDLAEDQNHDGVQGDGGLERVEVRSEGLVSDSGPNAEVAADSLEVGDTAVVESLLPQPPEGKMWTITFSDEFDGLEIDSELWNVGGGTEAEPQARRQGYWVKEAMSLDGKGNLVMSTYQKDGKYFSGVIDTQGIFQQAFGYFEARMQSSVQPGHWGAFWLMPDSFGATDNGGIDGVEIDIMERPWTGDQVNWTNHALHWDSYAEGADASKISDIPGISAGYHTYGLWWTPDSYRFYVDGVEVWASQAGGICLKALYLIFSDEVQSNAFFLSGRIEDAVLPDQTLVDYVRVYTLE